MSDWIPVSEKLPEEFQRVLVTIVNYKGDKVVSIANGTPLPKGHDDLISRVEVLEKLHEYFDPLADGEDICPADIYHEINALSGVIAADKEVDL